MSEKIEKIGLYEKVASKKEFLRAFQKNNKNFDVKFPKKAFDKICKLYGRERLVPNSFIVYFIQKKSTEIQRLNTVKKELDEGEAEKILEEIDHYCIIPKSLYSLDEEEQLEQGIKIKGHYIQDIMTKAGYKLDSLLEYAQVQIMSEELHETTKTEITYIVYQKIFSLIPLLKVYFKNEENFEIAFYSYRSILKKCNIPLEKVIPYLKIIKKEINREELIKTKMPLYECGKKREVKNLINPEIRDSKIYILKGGDVCHRYPEVPFDDFEINRNDETVFLNELIEKIDNKKKEIKNIYDNTDNHVIEVNDTNNKTCFIRKKIIDSILSSPDSEFDEYKTNDSDNNELIVSKKLLKSNKNPPLVKLYKKENKEDFIYVPKKEVEDNYKNFNYVRQEKNIIGKNKDNNPKELKCLLMDMECDNLPKLEESKPLFSIPGKDAIYKETKNNLVNKISKDNKDILLCEKDNKYVLLDTINQIKERDANIKNKNIKYKLKNIINEDEIIIIEYIEIFEKDLPGDYILIKDYDSPTDNIIVNKNDLLNELNTWEDPNDKIKLKNKVNNKEIEINPSKINIITPKKEEIPQNYEKIQEEKKNKITAPENALIKTNNSYITKTVAKKIIDDPEDFDTYYIKDINSKKIKVSKKQLKKDYEDEEYQYIIIITEEEPDNNIIISKKEIISILEEDPTAEEVIVKDSVGGKNYTIKKSKISVKPIKIEEINMEEQPQKIKKDLFKDIKDYYYIFNDKENKPHYIRGDILKNIKDYKSDYDIINFEIEDFENNKIEIPKETAIKLLENKDEPKYICFDDEESKEPILIEYTILEKTENDIDEPIEINKEGKKIKLKNIKIKNLKNIENLGEQPEEKKLDEINTLIKNIQKKEPLSDIVQIKDSKDIPIFIYEETLNKIEENKSDPEKTTYKGNTPMREEFISNKNPKKISPNTYIKLVEPNIIVDKNEIEKELKQYRPNKKCIKIKDVKGNQSEFDPSNISIYKASNEETDIVKILPPDFSDINKKLLIDIIPTNKLILSKDLNNQNILIKKKEGENLIKYPKTNFDNFTLFDKDGKKIKVSRKKIENDNNDTTGLFEIIEIKDNSNGTNEFVYAKELVESLNDKENENFEIRNKDGKKVKLNKKNIQIVKQDNKYTDIPEQGEEIKKRLLSEIKDCFIKVKDSKNNKETILRNSQLNEIINHKQRAPFINYEVLNPKNEKTYITKELCQEKMSNPKNKFILCYDETQKEKSFLVPLENIQNATCEGDDQFDIGNGQKIIFKNLRIKNLQKSPELGVQPEEEKMIKVLNLINRINNGPLNKNFKAKNIEGNTCFISNNYINKLQNESKDDPNDTKYKINDSFGKNKIIINKEIIDKESKPGEYILIKNKSDNQNYLVDLNDLLNNLKQFKSTDDEINVINSVDNKKMKINPLNIEIVSPYNDFPIEKIINKKIEPEKIEVKINEDDIKIDDNKKDEDEDKKGNEKNEEDINKEKGRTRLRGMPVRLNMPEKKTYKIRRAIIYKKQRKESQ